MSTHLRPLTVLLMLGGLWTGLPAAAARPPVRAPQTPPVVIAIVGETGANFLHRDFQTSASLAADLPRGAPVPTDVALPGAGPFAQRWQTALAGPLGQVPTGALLRLSGTRILVKNVYPQPRSALTAPSHGTGVLAASAARSSGSAPQALYVVVLGGLDEAWDWVADQPWIDVATSSIVAAFGGGRTGDVAVDTTCPAALYVRRSVAAGRPAFESAGNQEQLGNVSTPTGLPEVIRVGGVDEAGMPQYDVTRPYDVGDLLWTDPGASDADDTATRRYQGTSFAAPRAAGRAALLISYARQLLGDRGSGIRQGRLAVAATGARLPRRGPLADGSLTNTELRTLLQNTATPYLPEPSARYVVEGFGALGNTQMSLARAVLRGDSAPPDRSSERAVHDRMQGVRAIVTGPPRCGQPPGAPGQRASTHW